MLLKDKYEKIKNFMDNNNILTSKEECYCYAQDASNLFKNESIPDIVVFVKSTEDVINIMKYAYEHEIPVISRGAGTNMVGACVCNQGGIVLNFSKMNKIINIDSVNMTAKVQPGVVLNDLKISAEKVGLFFPPDPSNYKVSTVGGAIAQASGGANAFKYGTTKDYVLSLKVVTADGRLMTLGAETAKDAAGYQLSQLMVGSEGTLGIIVEATLKLIPKPGEKRVIAAYFDSTESAINGVNKIIEYQLFPSAIEFMDKNALITAEAFLNCGIKTEYNSMLLVEIDGYSDNIYPQISKTKQALEEMGAKDIKISDTEEDYNNIWQARRVSFAAAARLAPDVLSDDIIVPRRNLSQMVKICQEITSKYNLKMSLVGHAGDGNLHPQIAINLDNEEEFKNYQDAKSEIYNSAIALGGTISAEHGIGLEKKAYLSKTVDTNALEYMKLIKKVFDPKNILNPGKITD